MKRLFLISLVIFCLSCSLDLERSNPLDPDNSGILAPAEIVNLTIPQTSIGSVNLTWELQNDAAGYYIYRSLSYDGIYTKIADVEFTIDDEIGNYEDFSEELISETWYFYKVSGYASNGLEGYRSESTYTYYIDGSN